MTNGKKMYTIYCASCHGDKGDGNGVLAQRENFTECQITKIEQLLKVVFIMLLCTVET